MTSSIDPPANRPDCTRRSLMAIAVVLVGVSLVAAACGAKSPAASDATTPGTSRDESGGDPRPGGELSIALAGETNSFNPYVGQWTASAYLVANAVYDPLAAFDKDGIAKPYLAESFTPTGDFKTWLIKLRPNVTFHNGEKFDAAALKKNLDANAKGIMGSQASTNISDTKVVDDLTVQIDMKEPWATYPAALALQNGYPIAPAMIDDPAGGAANPIGTGPFEIVSWQRDNTLRVKRNPNYWRKDAAGRSLPYLDAITFKILPDGTARRQALQAGDVNALETSDPDTLSTVDKLASQGTGQLVTNAATETDEVIMAFNTTKPPFDDQNARKAVALAVDQDQLSITAYGNGAWPGSWGMFSDKSPYYISRQDAGYPDHDPAGARHLAEQYQQAHGTPLSFSFLVPATPEALKEAQAIQAQLAESGITMNIESSDLATVITKVVAAGDYQASVFLIWSSPTPDQGYIFLALKPAASGLSLNFVRYDDVELRTAMDDFRAQADPKKRIESFKAVQKSLAKNLQVLFLVHEIKGFYYGNDLYGVTSTTFPNSSTTAYNPYTATPFLTSTWRKS